ncbi:MULTISPECIES: DUF427 domain-containing protein [Cryobacterium]|uniref:DUF427 domain-containing protein n=1 Tax=Cryobacterium TaxID=69578 RepID=UPI000B873764|nr:MULTISPECIES: DUF427 domain-containing protein [Cryobacterium]TFD46025.1 DUF427 domain-containing protein [Cryobacterium sp. TMT1-2-1]TFD87596.1 DUF427 domain-containing protein [Cryobacterium psychrotolerans]
MKPPPEEVARPGPGQESVWDYPRPPRVESVPSRVVVRFGGRVIADTTDAVRVLETSHPPVYYLPRAAFAPGVLQPAEGHTVCEYKGEASYLTVVAPTGERADSAAWSYPSPRPGYLDLVGRVAVYPGRMDECTVDGERVRPQAGGFYGGWITSRVVGPFKGEPGTLGW